jgi:hypothetical protein
MAISAYWVNPEVLDSWSQSPAELSSAGDIGNNHINNVYAVGYEYSFGVRPWGLATLWGPTTPPAIPAGVPVWHRVWDSQAR